MKKVIMAICLALLVTGCSIKEMPEQKMEDIVQNVIGNDIKLNNRMGVGYSYYLPNGINILEVNENNEVLYANGAKYYLYIDLVSYQKKVKIEYPINKELYLSKAIVNSEKYGYIQIEQVDKQYFIEMMYNYAKIETYVYENQLEDTIINISYILSSIKYNDKVIESLIFNNVISDKGSKFNIFKPGDIGNAYMEKVEEDLTDTSSTIDDPDVIQVNPND